VACREVARDGGLGVARSAAAQPAALLEDRGPARAVDRAVDPAGFRTFRSELKALAREHRTCIGGAGADGAEAKAIGATLLSGGPVEEAERLAEIAG